MFTPNQTYSFIDTTTPQGALVSTRHQQYEEDFLANSFLNSLNLQGSPNNPHLHLQHQQDSPTKFSAHHPHQQISPTTLPPPHHLTPQRSRTSSPSKTSPSTLLTPAWKIEAEKVRRHALRAQFDRLAITVGMPGQGHRKGVVITKAVALLRETVEERERLIREIESRGGVVPEEDRGWEDEMWRHWEEKKGEREEEKREREEKKRKKTREDPGWTHWEVKEGVLKRLDGDEDEEGKEEELKEENEKKGKGKEESGEADELWLREGDDDDWWMGGTMDKREMIDTGRISDSQGILGEGYDGMEFGD